jgi:hypothetical protein
MHNRSACTARTGRPAWSLHQQCHWVGGVGWGGGWRWGLHVRQALSAGHQSQVTESDLGDIYAHSQGQVIRHACCCVATTEATL